MIISIHSSIRRIYRDKGTNKQGGVTVAPLLRRGSTTDGVTAAYASLQYEGAVGPCPIREGAPSNGYMHLLTQPLGTDTSTNGPL